MIILGVNDGHQASAAIIIDGVLKAAVAEERFTRRKNEHGYPKRAIEACLRISGRSAADIDRIAMATKALPPSYFRIRRDSDFSIADFWREQSDYWWPVIYEGRDVSYSDVFKDKIRPENFVYDASLIRDDRDTDGMREARRRYTAQQLDVPADRIVFKDHHAAHAYYGLLAAPPDDKKRIIFTADGFGDGANASVWIADGLKPLVEVTRTDQCHIGRMYRYATLLLAMKPAEHEYKVMGLAPYANPDYSRRAYEIYAETLQVDGLDFNYKVKPRDNFFHFRNKLAAERFDAIAYGIQRRTEELLTEWMSNGVARTGLNRVIFSGGVAQNIKANKRVGEMDVVADIFVPPGPHDESLSIGAAFMECIEAGDTAAPGAGFSNAYLGTSFDDAALASYLAEWRGMNGISVREVGHDDVAKVLARGDVVGRFNGRMEFGARALGNRSILADPRDPKVIQRINDTVKQRDFWMPFAPSIIAEREADYIVNPKRLDGRYMTLGFDSTPKAQAEMPAPLHPYDRTARPNIVHADQNPDYHGLITAFERQTGVGAVLNTSFNLHGEPVVESPSDAFSTFRRSALNYLYIGNFLVAKN